MCRSIQVTSHLLGALASLLALSAAVGAADKISYIELGTAANREIGDNLGSGFEGNNLAELPTGEQTLEGRTFKIGPGLIQLGSQLLPQFPEKVEGIAVDKKFAKLHLLHATCWGRNEGTPRFVKDGTLIGQYIVHYDDKSQEGIPIVYGEDVRDWFFDENDAEPTRGKVVWKGDNAVAKQVDCKIRVYALEWTNPKPDKKVVRIDYTSRKEETAAAPFCIAISVEEK